MPTNEKPLRDVLREVDAMPVQPGWCENAHRLARELRAIAPLLRMLGDLADELNLGRSMEPCNMPLLVSVLKNDLRTARALADELEVK